MLDIKKLREDERQSVLISKIRDSKKKTFFDDWTAVNYIGEGQYGEVFRIIKYDDMLGMQESALKIIKVAPEDIDKYLNEIKALKQLRDEKHIVKIEDYAHVSITNNFENTAYILIRMELLEKLPVKLPKDEVFRLGKEVCSALKVCHAQKIIHRDIKPQNILVSNQGVYKLGDFGEVKFLDKTSVTASQHGTINYMAPEVISRGRIDNRSDIYSLGMTMYSVLNGGIGEQIQQIRMSGKKLPSIEGVAPEFMTIIQKMCAYDKKDRYSDSQAVINALNNIDSINSEHGSKARSVLSVRKIKALIKYISGFLVLAVIAVGIWFTTQLINKNDNVIADDSSVVNVSSQSVSSSEDFSSIEVSNDTVKSFGDVKAGDYITFGNYPQNNGDTPEPIEWLVLNMENDRALVLSRYCLDCQKYNETYEEVTWETCTLRTWLNNEFFNFAFNDNERERILDVILRNPNNPYYGTKGGNDTTDSVFCLNIDEYKKYVYGINTYGYCTRYAVKNGCYTDANNYKNVGVYWLRSPGSGRYGVAYIDNNGNYDSGRVNYSNVAVRPAMYIDLDS